MNKKTNFCKLVEERIEESIRIGSLIYEEDDSIMINVCCPYPIAKSHVDTAEKILRWAVHLSSKNWMTKELINHFILTACRIARIEPYGV